MTESVPLSRTTLSRLPAGIVRPAFPVADVRPGIVHLGLGGFHRAHMARYTHDLMNRGSNALEWGIIGVGLLPNDRPMRDALAPQDRLYTLVERQDETEAATVIGCLCDVIFAGESSEAVLNALASPATRLVSLTVNRERLLPQSGDQAARLCAPVDRARSCSARSPAQCDRNHRRGLSPSHGGRLARPSPH